jgi:hypothetical protein
MRLPTLFFALGTVIVSSALVVPAAFAANDSCKVLTVEKFSQIMGYTASIDKTASTPMPASIRVRHIRGDNS